MRPTIVALVLAVTAAAVLACGGLAPPADPQPVAAPSADVILDLRFTKWRCDTAHLEFQSDGRCVDLKNQDWSCAFHQDGNRIELTWTPGPKTAAGNELHHWRGEVVDVVTMGGKIVMSNWTGDWRCTRDLG
jgi:hypothetical protein